MSFLTTEQETGSIQLRVVKLQSVLVRVCDSYSVLPWGVPVVPQARGRSFCVVFVSFFVSRPGSWPGPVSLVILQAEVLQTVFRPSFSCFLGWTLAYIHSLPIQ